MQPSKKFAFDKTFLKSFRRYLGAGDLGLYRMTSTIYGIALLFAAIGIPATMIKYVAEFKNALYIKHIII
jgi:O-antigen/teichoic acid export membrane protein